MTKMKELYEKVSNDSELQAKFFEITKNAEEAGKEATGEKLISFAKDTGYDITLDEMKDFFRELAESEQATLTDAELDMVAGGKSSRGIFNVALSVIGLGIVCAIGSIIGESLESGTCGKVFE